MARCDVCFRHCELKDGQTGACGARAAVGGEIRPLYYGRISALALDPIEKKPLARFHPGSRILSVGGLGCSLPRPLRLRPPRALPAPSASPQPRRVCPAPALGGAQRDFARLAQGCPPAVQAASCG